MGMMVAVCVGLGLLGFGLGFWFACLIFVVKFDGCFVYSWFVDYLLLIL